MDTNSLKDLGLKSVYRSGDDDIFTDFYKKALEAVDLCTYFAQQCIGSHIITNANATLLA